MLPPPQQSARVQRSPFFCAGRTSTKKHNTITSPITNKYIYNISPQFFGIQEVNRPTFTRHALTKRTQQENSHTSFTNRSSLPRQAPLTHAATFLPPCCAALFFKKKPNPNVQPERMSRSRGRGGLLRNVARYVTLPLGTQNSSLSLFPLSTRHRAKRVETPHPREVPPRTRSTKR